ncbi:MAG: hypothetical protein KBD01_00640 [Acidobacteria bacterium]|nr:hypothetical protein [Acidobacteriota bacterium]
MSLPAGVVNRAAVVATSPRAVGGVLRLTLQIFVVLAPLLLLVAAQVPGVALRYQCTAIQSKIDAERLERRKLLAERARLLAPDRLRREAERLQLRPPLPGEGPWPITSPPPPPPAQPVQADPRP